MALVSLPVVHKEYSLETKLTAFSHFLSTDSRWEKATEVTVARQKQLEESASHLACFQAAESQLRPWLMEKELMMGVLGPLSIDPNMLNAQKQQVQVSHAT